MTPAASTIRVATWNIRAAIGPGEPFPPAWWRHVRRDRFERIADVIAELEADVVALQEVSVLTPHGEVFDQPLELARLSDRHVRYAAVHAFALVEPENGRAIGAATWGNALLTRGPVDGGFAIGLPVGADDEPVEPAGSGRPLAGVTFRDAPYGTREARCAVGGRVSLAGSDVTIVNAHLTYAGTEQRRAQADELARIADGSAGPVVVAGDFNAAIEDPALRSLAAGFDDAFGAVGVEVGDQRRASCGALPIDHLLSRGLRVVDCRVVTEAGDASDHLPVVATFEVSTGELDG
ncbi:MAG TPA: endonuclease/exonuclease/phosphatase family protein [Methylomirabilota bacterium]|nr:endonuclease/exonuclease/phosphatase family protein [Methylomirabilota bacterium]